MTSKEAKKFIVLHRPGLDDSLEPQIVEALELIKHDSELLAWYEKHIENERAISQSFKQIKVPVLLREKIMAENCPVQPANFRNNRTLINHIAVAAILLLLVTNALWFSLLWQPSLDTYRIDMARIVSVNDDLDIEARNLEDVRHGFYNIGWPTDYNLPDTLTSLHVLGGLALNWEQNKVSTLCLETDDKKYIWLFIIDSSALPDPPTKASPNFQYAGKLMTASWSLAGKTYVLAGDVNKNVLNFYFFNP
ncbi:MAG: hypothetical protein V7735_13425 [Photobacterium frigidiphilum]|uniref:hypothetical protein n=1 Tax=Photobacterium frigidiphilum TaxID=264736 RepID=UPI003001BF93